MNRKNTTIALGFALVLILGCIWFGYQQLDALPDLPDAADLPEPHVDILRVSSVNNFHEGNGDRDARDAPSARGALEQTATGNLQADAPAWEGVPSRDDILLAIKENDYTALRSMRNALLQAGDEALPVLEGLLHSRDPILEKFSISVLVRMQTKGAAIIAVGHMLRREGVADAQWDRLARQVGGMLDGGMVDLVAGMLQEAEGEARKRLLTLLRHVSSEDALFRMLIASGEYSDEELTQATVLALFRSGKPGTVEILKDLMTSHPDPNVVSMAAIGMAENGTADAVQFLADRGNGDDWGAESARWALARVANSHGQNTLIEVSNDASYATDVRLAALHALGHGGASGNVTRALRNLTLTTRNPEIRIAAEEQLDAQQQQTVSATNDTELANIETWF